MTKTAGDPNNTFKVNANPNSICEITKLVFDHYNKCSKCQTCLLWMEEKTPSCIFECKYYIHPRKTTAPTIDCVFSKNDPLSIHLSRYNLVYNYYYTQHILRTCKNNHLIMHHFNQNPYDDSETNLGVCVDYEHSAMHSNLLNRTIGPLIGKSACAIVQFKDKIVKFLQENNFNKRIKIKNYLNLFLIIDLDREKIQELCTSTDEIYILELLYNLLDQKRKDLKKLRSGIITVQAYNTENALKIIKEEMNNIENNEEITEVNKIYNGNNHIPISTL